ncbi:MerR family transcriptional regulator [candidate division KSB1 bacterium]|nr:MerR family transcriptional regulator [candidate division KSB1 bacterium]
MEQYLKRDIAKLIGETPRKIQFWTDSGLVLPDILSSGGKGVPKIYSGRNLIEFKMIQVIRDRLGMGRGIQIGILKIIFDGLRKGEYDRGIKTIKFKDFYTNPEWGVERELLFIFHGWAGPRGFHIVEKNKSGFFDPHPTIFASAIENASGFTVLMLGKIKNIALKGS